MGALYAWLLRPSASWATNASASAWGIPLRTKACTSLPLIGDEALAEGGVGGEQLVLAGSARLGDEVEVREARGRPCGRRSPLAA